VCAFIVGRGVESANAKRAKAGMSPLVGVTNHSLRRTFCSLLYAAGTKPDYVMRQMGHESAALALEVYSNVMVRNPDDGPLDDLVADRTDRIGTHSGTETISTPDPVAPADTGDRCDEGFRGRDSNPDYLIQSPARATAWNGEIPATKPIRPVTRHPLFVR
jgi:Phage integrase family